MRRSGADDYVVASVFEETDHFALLTSATLSAFQSVGFLSRLFTAMSSVLIHLKTLINKKNI